MAKGKMLDSPAFIPYTICPACGKCIEVCPAHIDIPKALQIYADRCNGSSEAGKQLWKMQSTAQPLDCIECGACTMRCPQKLEVAAMIHALALAQLADEQTAEGEKANSISVHLNDCTRK
ncbi:4Fe-4S dicluster domain-containing protein [Dysosmobacter welbionis]|uniref:4Fe-4S dicluster domain-containing protein n=1 Tax=Dysosmobacter welbionis TaxID=2093857 RepID=UPI0032C0BF94